MLATLWRLIEVQNHEHAFNSLCLGKLGKTHIDVAGIAARILQLIDTIGQPIDPLPTPPSPSLTSSHPYLPFAAWCCLLNHLRALQKFFPAIVGRLANVIGRRLETADRRLRPTQLSFIAIPSLGLLYRLRHFNAIFMRIFAHCNGPLSQYKRCEDYFNCDSCNASRCCLCDEGTVLFQLTFHFFHSLSSQLHCHIYFASFSTLFDKLQIPFYLPSKSLSLEQLFASRKLPVQHMKLCINSHKVHINSMQQCS